MLPEGAHALRQLLRTPQIVGIEKGDQLSTRGVNPSIASRRSTAIALIDHADLRIVSGEYCFGGVRRTVVHDHYFKIAKVLREHAVEARLDSPLSVVRWY